MKKMNLHLLLGFSIFAILFARISRAQEEGEAKAASKGRGGVSLGSNEKGLPPWFETETRMMELMAKIKAKEEVIGKLFEEKKRLSVDSPQLKVVLDNIVKEHKALDEMVMDYEKKRNFLKFRFPERGMKGERSYDRIEVKSVDDMEKQLGLDGRLTRNIKKMRKQYGVVEKDEKAKLKAADKKAEAAIEAHKGAPGSIEDEGVILLKK